MTKSLQLFFLLLISSLFACEDDDLAAPVPAFITINDIVVKSTDPVDPKIVQLIDEICALNLVEVSQLADALKDKLGISNPPKKLGASGETSQTPQKKNFLRDNASKSSKLARPKLST